MGTALSFHTPNNMADEDLQLKPRKSVAFADGQTIVDGDGQVTSSNMTEAGEKDSAESHGKSEGDQAVDEVTQMFEGLAKKKKSKKPKKKKKKKAKSAEDDFEAKLAEAGATGDDAAVPSEDKENAAPTGVQEGDLVKGTGIWAHDEQKPINYESLLSRFFALLHDSHPDLASSGGKSYKIPPPQCLREGNKKTIFANIAEICKRMKRTDEHVTQFLFAELGTSGSVDGSRRLVIKGRFQQKQIENVLRRYIVEYVTCKTCRSPDTELNKGENRLYFVTCNSCGSRRSVTAIKTGFSAQVGKRKRQQA